jgi:DNA-binding transcriptional regulator YdaS (Cro superfamily)
MNTNAICKAVESMGGQVKLAKPVGVSASMVYQWVRGIRQVPAERCPSIEKATGGKVRCEDLRPDVDWSVLRCNCGEKEAA